MSRRDPNKTALSLVGGALVAFIVAALFKFVFPWGETVATVAIVISALSFLYCITEPQALNTYLETGFRVFLFVCALVAAIAFGLFFLSWTMLGIYLVAVVAATLFAINRA